MKWPRLEKRGDDTVTDSETIRAVCDFYGVSLHDFDGRNAQRGRNATRLPVKARRLACKIFYGKGYTKAKIARLVGLSGASPVRYLITGKR